MIFTLKDIALMVRGAWRILLCSLSGHSWEVHLIGDVREECSRCHEVRDIQPETLEDLRNDEI